ncbi:MAG: hypothetical protein NTW86_10935 [Candidatus Sumerlaeota bacterium]|nr:hypothetical protein [Candidatus Sumerlaeota bacterium]
MDSLVHSSVMALDEPIRFGFRDLLFPARLLSSPEAADNPILQHMRRLGRWPRPGAIRRLWQLALATAIVAAVFPLAWNFLPDMRTTSGPIAYHWAAIAMAVLIAQLQLSVQNQDAWLEALHRDRLAELWLTLSNPGKLFLYPFLFVASRCRAVIIAAAGGTVLTFCLWRPDAPLAAPEFWGRILLLLEIALLSWVLATGQAVLEWRWFAGRESLKWRIPASIALSVGLWLPVAKWLFLSDLLFVVRWWRDLLPLALRAAALVLALSGAVWLAAQSTVRQAHGILSRRIDPSIRDDHATEPIEFFDLLPLLPSSLPVPSQQRGKARLSVSAWAGVALWGAAFALAVYVIEGCLAQAFDASVGTKLRRYGSERALTAVFAASAFHVACAAWRFSQRGASAAARRTVRLALAFIGGLVWAVAIWLATEGGNLSLPSNRILLLLLPSVLTRDAAIAYLTLIGACRKTARAGGPFLP